MSLLKLTDPRNVEDYRQIAIQQNEQLNRKDALIQSLQLDNVQMARFIVNKRLGEEYTAHLVANRMEE